MFFPRHNLFSQRIDSASDCQEKWQSEMAMAKSQSHVGSQAGGATAKPPPGARPASRLLSGILQNPSAAAQMGCALLFIRATPTLIWLCICSVCRIELQGQWVGGGQSDEAEAEWEVVLLARSP